MGTFDRLARHTRGSSALPAGGRSVSGVVAGASSGNDGRLSGKSGCC